ncbi:MAG: hypothetical protein HFI07_03060 [Lachnospiraceae bacterium]|jgi:hypothetical protein|nr:hypothetical protein [Lachnospiraceae bacterium]
MGKQINITRKEFQCSCKNHYHLYKNADPSVSLQSRRLLLFYSVECGLKSLIMKNIGKNTYEELKKYSEEEGKHIHGHDLKAMVKEVGIEHKYPLKRIHLAKEGQCAPDRYNELWRYGAAVKDEEEQIKAEKMLEGIAEWITQRL